MHTPRKVIVFYIRVHTFISFTFCSYFLTFFYQIHFMSSIFSSSYVPVVFILSIQSIQRRRRRRRPWLLSSNKTKKKKKTKFNYSMCQIYVMYRPIMCLSYLKQKYSPYTYKTRIFCSFREWKTSRYIKINSLYCSYVREIIVSQFYCRSEEEEEDKNVKYKT